MYERECAELLQLESKGREAGLGKKRATIDLLNRQIMFTSQNVEAASLEIATLRDDELYHRLLVLLCTSTNMWQQMHDTHQEQTVILQKSPNADLSRAVGATSDRHIVSTQQLEDVLNAWHNAFKEHIPTQRKYLENLNYWLRLNLIPLESASVEKLDHQTDLPISVIPPIYKLCQEWHQALEKLPVQIVLEAINSFVGLVHSILQLHGEELKHKKRAETLERQLHKKVTALKNYESKYFEPTAVVEEKKDLLDDPLKEKKRAIDELSKRVDDEKEKTAKAVQESRNMIRDIFSSGLPVLFEAVTRFSSSCSQTYQGLCKNLSPEGFAQLILET
ncbi:hypothetical protein O6H91_Y390900 [Diphasiastrum complanatum]|nr:hypothetical protein O6H91_Y390900 [Diphasiastrum complanatum]